MACNAVVKYMNFSDNGNRFIIVPLFLGFVVGLGMSTCRAISGYEYIMFCMSVC